MDYLRIKLKVQQRALSEMERKAKHKAKLIIVDSALGMEVDRLSDTAVRFSSSLAY